MPLFKKKTSFMIDPISLSKSFTVPFARMRLTIGSDNQSIYQRAAKLCRDSLIKRTEPAGSFLVFGMVFGNHAENQEEADAIWADLWKLYNGVGENKELFNFLSKVLGTVLMIEVAKDNGCWEYEPDPEKKEKLGAGERPDAAIYNLRKKK